MMFAWLLATGFCLLLASDLHSQSPAALDLKQRLEKKTLYMNGFPTSLSIRYDGKGLPAEPLERGSWTYGQIYIERVDFSEGHIEISGKRVGQSFNRGWKEKRTAEGQKLTIATEPSSLTPQQADDIVEAIFVAENKITKTVPNQWIKRDTTGAPLFSATDKAYRVGGAVQPPRSIETKAASGDEPAKKGVAAFTGTVIIQAIISEKGEVVAVRLQKPLGMGLDEKAISEVTKWTFVPARKDGKPVPVEINIEVNFNLY